MRPDLDLLCPSPCAVQAGGVEDVGAEIHSGIHLERRGLLQLSALGGLLGLSAREARHGPMESNALAFEAFLAEAFGLAQRAVGAAEQHQDSYLMRMASLMTRIVGVPDIEAKAFGDLEGLTVGRHQRRMPISVLELRLEPHAAIPLHNHHGYAGNLIGLEGEMRVVSYDPVGELTSPTPTEPFLLRQTSDLLMAPGRVATLATNRDNFHTLVAGPEGGRALDIFTFFSDPGRSGYFEVADKPRDEALRIFEARPTG